MTEQAIIGLVSFIGMFAMVLMGIPIFVSMLTASFIGFWMIGGQVFALTQFTSAPVNLAASYTFAVLPLFMLLGVLAGETGIAEDAYSSAKKWIGRVRGGLLMATVGGNAIFGACSGISISGNVVFGKIAMPELERHGYDKRVSMGCITAAGALSTLIPPSMGILIFSILTDISVGRALTGGIGPGLLTGVLICLMILIISWISPDKIPGVNRDEPRVSILEKLKTIRFLLPIFALFTLIVVGTYKGFFPATVGGAIGSFAVILYAFARRMPVQRIARAVWEAVVINAGIFPIIIGGTIFSRLIALSGLADSFAHIITSLQMPPMIIFLIVLLFYIFCGCVMDIISILIITIPIVFPLLVSLGFDPYVICIVLVFITEIAGLTPPIGMNVFAVSNVLKVDPVEVFKGVLPFFIVEFVMVILIALFPQIVTFIPSLLMK